MAGDSYLTTVRKAMPWAGGKGRGVRRGRRASRATPWADGKERSSRDSSTHIGGIRGSRWAGWRMDKVATELELKRGLHTPSGRAHAPLMCVRSHSQPACTCPPPSSHPRSGHCRWVGMPLPSPASCIHHNVEQHLASSRLPAVRYDRHQQQPVDLSVQHRPDPNLLIHTSHHVDTAGQYGGPDRSSPLPPGEWASTHHGQLGGPRQSSPVSPGNRVQGA